MKNLKMWWMNSQSNLSKAFSKSIFRAIRPFLLLEMVGMNDLLCEKDVVARISTRNKTGLEVVDEVVQVWFDPVNKDFGDSFVKGVT